MNENNLYAQITVKNSGTFSIGELKEQALYLGCNGIHEYSMEESEVDEILGDAAYCGGEIPGALLNKVEHSQNGELLTFYFNSESEANKFLEIAPVDSKLELFPVEDWNTPWRKHYKTIEISKNIKVVPEWLKEFDSPNEIYIYPGMGFGTGTHETTALCLSILSDLYDQRIVLNSVLDFGCGSGILGIGALKLFNSKIDFCDIDREALVNTEQNLDINFKDSGRDLSGLRLVTRARFQPVTEYNLVFANILAPILKEELHTIVSSVTSGGLLILSGLLKDQTKEIIEIYQRAELELVEERIKNDWAALLFRKK